MNFLLNKHIFQYIKHTNLRSYFESSIGIESQNLLQISEKWCCLWALILSDWLLSPAVCIWAVCEHIHCAIVHHVNIVEVILILACIIAKLGLHLCPVWWKFFLNCDSWLSLGIGWACCSLYWLSISKWCLNAGTYGLKIWEW